MNIWPKKKTHSKLLTMIIAEGGIIGDIYFIISSFMINLYSLISYK